MDQATPVAKLVERLLNEPDLWPGLLAPTEQGRFAEMASDLGARWQLDVSPDEIQEQLVLNRRTWLERWV